MQRARTGFTLIELITVLAIVAVLAAVALPSYQASIERGRRADAKALLMHVVSRQESLFTEMISYSSVYSDLGLTSDKSPEGHYQLHIETGPSGCGPAATKCTYFKVAAISLKSSDQCTRLSLDSRGTRSSAGADTDFCWR
ncbi:type IV pilin protein [Agaribacterium haliotis]|uniref:type IV pilin protein n=1 Tax=Agaribacterium haliotis TaxID=2013869 RepID=UPI000BB55894|nr:type IV pilin protein [Agaribacterium haliotis]